MSIFRALLKNAYQKKVVKNLEKKVRQTALIVDAELVARTPVDTGRARSNWLPSLNVPEVSIVEPGGKKDISGTLTQFSITDTILISNNLPYIRRLNDGYSKQAPAGFVEDAITVGKNFLK